MLQRKNTIQDLQQKLTNEELADLDEESLRDEQMEAELEQEREAKEWESFLACSPLPNVVITRLNPNYTAMQDAFIQGYPCTVSCFLS